MKNLFNSIRLTKPRTNHFDLTHDVKLSCNMGQLIPVCCIDTVPGDKFNISCESLLRFAPLIAPVMHRMDVYVHYFFVPYRILWRGWQTFITNQSIDGNPVPEFPYVIADEGALSTTGTIADYLGIPIPHSGNTEKISAMPFAAYYAIWAEYYRDQNLMSADVDWAQAPDYVLSDGNNTSWWTAAPRYLNGNPYYRCWEHDYFTASLPFAQKGDAVDIPLGDVILNPDAAGRGFGVKLVSAVDGSNVPGTAWSDLTGDLHSGTPTTTGDKVFIDPVESLTTEATTINDLRRAFKLQEWLERNARGGTRYTEHIRVHFGVTSSDKRLQRPEYITGTKSPVVVSEVLNTTGTDALPQGNMSGHGLAVTAGQYGGYFCEEHGLIMGIMSVMPKTAYQEGIPKHFLKYNDAFERFYPSFAHLGEQEVLNKEIYAFQGAASENTFGYVPRYAEYKFEPNRVAGDFRNTLSFWHFGRVFSPTPPALNAQFVACVPRTDPFAVTAGDSHHLYVHFLNKITARRPMPVFGTPRL